jgi:hypothetical protein
MSRNEILLAMGGLVLLSAAKWRWSVQVALVITVFEGVLRKWVFPGAGQYIYFLKDFVLLGAYIGYYTAAIPKRSGLNPALKITLVLGCAAVVLQAFNPNLGSIVTGVFGIKAYLWYVPLLWILPEVFRNKSELFRFTDWFIRLAVPLGILAMVQFQAPLDSPLNAYAANTEAVSSFGEDGTHAQVTGTFSYIAGYTSFLFFTFCLLAANLLGSQKPIVVWSNAAILCLVLGNMCMSGGRKNFVCIGLSLAVLSVVVLKHRQMLPGLHRTLLAVAVAVGLALMLFDTAVDAMMYRARSNEDFIERTMLFMPLIDNLKKLGLDSYGAGLTLAERSELWSALNVAPPRSLPPSMDFEANQVLVELGAVGFLAWYSLRIALLWALWATWQRLQDPRLKVLAAGAFTFHLAHLYLSTYLNHIANLYLWFMAGFILLLPRLDSNKKIPLSSEVRRAARRRRPAAKLAEAPLAASGVKPRFGESGKAP